MIEFEISEELRYTYRADNNCQVIWYWCCEEFGHPGYRGGDRWTWDNLNKFKFRDQSDATLFALRWM